MAGSGYKIFTPSSLTSEDVNTYLMQQSVMVFASSAARSTALPVPTGGMATYLQDTNRVEVWNGTSWISLLNNTRYNEMKGTIPLLTIADTRTSVSQFGLIGQIGFSTNRDSTNFSNNPSAFINGTLMSAGADTDVALNFVTGNRNISNTAMFMYPNGQVTTPRQPSFSVRPTSGNTTSGVVIYNGTVVFNTGNHYSTSTGRFTAPVGGNYLFTASFFSLISTGGSAGFKINNGAFMVLAGREGAEGYYEPYTMSAILKLSANDYVEMQVYTGTIHLNSVLNMFAGHLLG
jgi:hypothetical protein